MFCPPLFSPLLLIYTRLENYIAHKNTTQRKKIRGKLTGSAVAVAQGLFTSWQLVPVLNWRFM